MIFTQFVDDALGCASYLVGDPRTGEAVVVDPASEIEQYLEEAERRDARIVRVLETHTHADHLSGHGRLALEHGASVSIHPAGKPEYAFEPLGDGVEVYPGHVAGSLCGAQMSSKASTTIGFERRFNAAVSKDEDAFVAEMSAGSAPRPPNMERIVEVNRGPFL